MYSDFCNKLLRGEDKLAVVGLGYVGLPLAVSLSKRLKVIGYDRDPAKINRYAAGIDPTREVGDEAIRQSSVLFTADDEMLRHVAFYIVAVPTPIHEDHTPDLSCLEDACRVVGRNLHAGSVVVFESTVYPGVTEEICIPLLEAVSGLRCGEDFKVGYSPERINPGDRTHRLDNVRKVIAGVDTETLELMARVYGLVVKADLHRAPSIRVAEAAKVVENSQRDINIAFMNEVAIMMDRLGVDTKAVLEAASTKWNFLDFSPGLVGGHCIGVDPYYLAYSAERAGHLGRVIPAGRLVNDGMGEYVAERVIAGLRSAGKEPMGARVAILGFTFKENCPDVRNTRVFDVIRSLQNRGAEILLTDPLADREDVKREYGLRLLDFQDLQGADAVVVAVGHEKYRGLTAESLGALFGEGCRFVMDVKGILDRSQLERAGFSYQRL